MGASGNEVSIVVARVEPNEEVYPLGWMILLAGDGYTKRRNPAVRRHGRGADSMLARRLELVFSRQ